MLARRRIQMLDLPDDQCKIAARQKRTACVPDSRRFRYNALHADVCRETTLNSVRIAMKLDRTADCNRSVQKKRPSP